MAVRFIDKLVKAARLEPVKERTVKLDSGDEIVVWVRAADAAGARPRKQGCPIEDANAFARLLIQRQWTRTARRLFGPGDAATCATLSATPTCKSCCWPSFLAKRKTKITDMKSA